MITYLLAALIILCPFTLPAQAPDASPLAQTQDSGRVARTHSSDKGFSYSLPLDWEIVDTKPMLPVVRQQVTAGVTDADEKKGIECAQIDLMARDGNPPSIIEAITVSFDCIGQKFTDKDLASLATGVAAGLNKTFTITDAVYGAYTLGTHSVWIERATGTFISHPDMKRTVETVCSILMKGVVCWLAVTVDVAALQTFERGAVTLDSEDATALVPVDVLNKKP